MPPTDPFADFEKLRLKFQRKSKFVRLLLVDLVGSTSFKSKNPEINWVTRLKKFYNAVCSTTNGYGTCKFLGDGILIASYDANLPAKSFLQLAETILTEVTNLNNQLPGDHALKIRLILNSGQVFPFDHDPQGSAVDKLFRMEKLVPEGRIGMTEEFARDLGVNFTPIARFKLKGLPGTHGLILTNNFGPDAMLKDIRENAYLAALWAQPGVEEGAHVKLVGGYIPGGSITVQMGDVNAKLRALLTLAALGFASAVEVLDSSNFQPTGYNQNIVSIGGPCFNNVTEHFLSELPVGFEIHDDDDNDDTPLIIRVGGEKIILEAQYEESRLTLDWGLFVRMHNPHDKSRHVIIACGIESPGVEGIVQAFTRDNPDFSYLMERVIALAPTHEDDPIPEFFCIMPIPVALGHMPALPPAREQIKHLYKL
jgi:class 3 adenylate cyclase